MHPENVGQGAKLKQTTCTAAYTLVLGVSDFVCLGDGNRGGRLWPSWLCLSSPGIMEHSSSYMCQEKII